MGSHLKSDAEECLRLAELSDRPNVCMLLIKEYERLKILANAEAGAEEKKQPSVQKKADSVFTVKIDNYGWDQSDKYVKLYVSLNNVESLPTEGIISTYNEKSFDLQVLGLDKKNYSLAIKNLLLPILPAGSYHKVKKNTVIIYLEKSNSTTWSHLTETEKKATERKTPKMDNNTEDDPGMGVMNLMRQMYEDGDDDMKRTIAKAWTEARSKKDVPF